MSWDFYITSKPCPTCGHSEESYESDVKYNNNYTSNMYPMMKEAGFDWSEMEGKTGKEALEWLAQLIGELEVKPSKFKDMNPSNGWGNYDGFLHYLRRMAEWCEKRPDGFVHISR